MHVRRVPRRGLATRARADEARFVPTTEGGSDGWRGSLCGVWGTTRSSASRQGGRRVHGGEEMQQAVPGMALPA